MKDRNVVIFGLSPTNPDDVETGSNMIGVHVSDQGDLYTILTLAGLGMEPINAFGAGGINTDGWRGPFLGAAAPGFHLNAGTGDPDAYYYAPNCGAFGAGVLKPANHQLV